MPYYGPTLECVKNFIVYIVYIVYALNIAYENNIYCIYVYIALTGLFTSVKARLPADDLG
ncbi:hypothetical protein NTGM5_210002 [Candidatus Nitrotoga sp. M5]|nr:hypothetical protein NTGM5_210002 [Candidatus Nitrotoga sp. M5]